MLNFISLDIGGANTKISYFEINQNGEIFYTSRIFYFPFWKIDINLYPEILKNHIENITEINKINFFIITMTAEIADIFPNKKTGVLKIINLLLKIISKNKFWFYTINSTFIKYEETLNEPLTLAASNWIAIGSFFSKIYPDCLIIDMGSTTTDFIIIEKGKIINKGITDFERLMHGELLYSGFIRTPISSITDSVFLRKNKCYLSSELFSIIADAHLILGNIEEKNYSSDSPDGRPKTKNYSLTRLARMVCSEIGEISKQEIYEIAFQVTNIQLEKIVDFIKKIFESKPLLKNKPILLSGIGRNWLKINLHSKLINSKFILVDDIKDPKLSVFDPSTALGFLFYDFWRSNIAKN